MDLNLGDMQFYWRLTHRAQEANPVSNFLPFSLGIDRELSLVRQKKNSITESALKLIYQLEANVGYLEDGNDLAGIYGTDFLNWISQHLVGLEDHSILEIGCGRGYILRELYKKGFKYLTGIDPNPASASNAKKISVIKGFYPDEYPGDRHKVILHYDVLEHTHEPVEFLARHLEHLDEDGLVLAAVPDCTEAVSLGDISMCLHEHINYFTIDSLKRVFELAGLHVIDIKKGSSVGTLYIAGKKMAGKARLATSANDCYHFEERAAVTLGRFKEIYSSLSKNTGFYVPLRFFPYLASVSNHLPEGARFFDDSSAFRGKYYDGFSPIIEEGIRLQQNPVDCMLIGSHVFSQKITQKVLHFNGGCRVFSLSEICGVK